MNKELLKGISVAGLFHDIGKFAERAYAVTEADKDTVWQDYRYGHAYNTEQVLVRLFGERLSQPLPNKKHDKECTILNLAARHHNPRNIYETMVSEADRIASGHERAKADEYSTFETSGRERKSQIPLISILGRVRLPERQRTFKDSINKRYRIGVPPIGDINLLEATKPADPENYPASQVRHDYKTHWDSFVSSLVSSEGQSLDLIDNFDTVFEICRIYQWCLPASARKDDIEDSSLFEHQKITAGLAACLCAYHENLAERDTWIRKRRGMMLDKNHKYADADHLKKPAVEKWIRNGPDNELIKQVEEFGKYIARTLKRTPNHRKTKDRSVDIGSDEIVTTSQIRQIFSKMKTIEAKGLSSEQLVEFMMLKPLMAYASGRHKKTGLKRLRERLDWSIDAVLEQEDEEQKKGFNNFCRLFEAILAYHKAHGGN